MEHEDTHDDVGDDEIVESVAFEWRQYARQIITRLDDRKERAQ